VDVVFAVSEQGHRIFAAGGRFGNDYVLVRAHDATTGAILWQNTIPGAFNALLKGSLHASHGLVFVSGDIETSPNDFDAFVHAYDQSSGALVWSDLITDPTNDETNFTVAAAGSRLIASRVECDDLFSPGDCSWFVRSYDLHTGDLEWQQRLALGVPMGFINATVAHAGTIILGGTDLSFATWVVAVLDSSTGGLLWHDSADSGGVFGLAVQGNRFFAAGNLDLGFWVRAYALRR
jgi:outer membrane protein assembly factor BamB